MENVGRLDSKSKIWELNWNISVMKTNVIGLNASVQRQTNWVWVKQNPVLSYV